MRHYPVGEILKDKEGHFSIKLFNGKIKKEFPTQIEAAAFVVGTVQEFCDKQNVNASVRNVKPNGIATYLMFDPNKAPYGVSDFVYKRTHSSFFPKGSLRSVIDETNVRYSSIARVNSSGTTAQVKWSWFRIIMSTVILTTIAAFVFYFFTHHTQAQLDSAKAFGLSTVDNHVMIGVMIGITVLSYISIGLTLGIKLWYKILIGWRKNRTLEKIRAIQKKDWRTFNKYVKRMQKTSLAFVVVEIILSIVLVSLISQSFYYQEMNKYWESKVIVILTIAYLVYLSVIVLGIYIFGIFKSRRQRQGLIDTYLPEGHKPYYKGYILVKGIADEKFPETRAHYILPDAPAKVKAHWEKHAEEPRLKAYYTRKAEREAMQAAINKQFPGEKTK